MDEQWRIELLGWLRAAQGGRVVTRFQTQKTAALLAFLAYHRRRSHPREALIELLWPGCEPDAGRNSLRQALSSLRRQLEPPGVPAGAVIIANRGSVELNPQTVTTDVAELETALEAAGRAGGGSAEARELERAVGLYRGDLLPGIYQDWVAAERERLRAAFLKALRGLVAHLSGLRDFARAAEFARRAAAADPVNEEARRDLMRALAAAGQPGEALRQFRELERALELDIGAVPQAATRELAREIERRAARGVAPGAVPPPLPSPAAPAPKPEIAAGIVTLLLADAAPPRRFGRPSEALAGAVEVLAARGGAALRLALDTGEAEGTTLERAAALVRAAHPGQILCSARTAVMLPQDLGPGLTLVDLGLFRLDDRGAPERIFEVHHPARPREGFPPPLAPPGHTGRLPLRLTRFFGREEELARVEALLEDGARLVTLTGPGGTGKTRLAIELGARLHERFHGAVWFVGLADIADARVIPSAILDAMRLARAGSREPLEQVARALAGDRALLLLDNFEHVVAPGGAEVVKALLERAPGLGCVVTSRQRLLLAGECELPIPPLAAPRAESSPEELVRVPSVKLFLDRAQAVRPDFQVTSANAAAVAELCRRLDGIPLALELAAGRAAVLNPAQMVERLVHRFDLLVSRERDAPARHRTLRAAIDWSRELLTPELARFFARLSVLRGSFDLEAAEAVAEQPAALDFLGRLRECSLLIVEGDRREVRFRLLDTIREYAAEEVPAGELEALERRHAAHFLALAERGAVALFGPEQAAWLDRLAAEHENFRAALAASTVDATLEETGLRLGAALWRFWQVRGHAPEGRHILGALLARAPERTAARGQALRASGALAAFENDSRAARAAFDESLAIARALGDRKAAVMALNGLGAVAGTDGDFATSRSSYEQALAIARELGDRKMAAILLNNLGVTAWRRGERAIARAQIEEAVAIERELGNRLVVGMSQDNLGLLALDAGERARARAAVEEAIAIFRELGYERGIAQSTVHLGRICVAERDGERARAFAEEGLAGYRRLGIEEGVAYALQVLAGAALLVGDRERAQALAEESLGLARKTGDPRRAAEALRVLAEAALDAGDDEAARAHYAEGLLTLRTLGELPPVIAACLEGLAALSAPERAARLLGAAAALREAIGAPLPPEERAGEAATREAARGALGEAAFREAFDAGRALTWEKAAAHAPRAARVGVRKRVRPRVHGKQRRRES